MNESRNDSRGMEPESWRSVVDRVVDLISSSKSTLRILNEKLTITDENKAEAAKQSAKDVIKRKLLRGMVNFRNVYQLVKREHYLNSFQKVMM